jgi:hypothetical protein
MAIALNVNPGDVISSYASLRVEIAAWLDRDDLAERIPGFIRLSEARLNRVLRVPDMEVETVLTANAEETPLPLDFLAMRELDLSGPPNRPLRCMSPDALVQNFDGTAGVTQAYAVTGRTLRLAPPPSAPVGLRMVYFAQLPSLSDERPSNWLLAQAPDVYLFAALLQATAFIGDTGRIGQWKAAYDEALAELISAGTRSRWGASPLVPNTVVQVRGVRC